MNNLFKDDECARLPRCPFGCRPKKLTVEDARAPDEGFFVQCYSCGAQGPLSISPHVAKEKWSKRA